MQIEKQRPNVFEITLHAYELSALVAGARWAAQSGELPTDAQEQLTAVLKDYDAALQQEEPDRPTP